MEEVNYGQYSITEATVSCLSHEEQVLLNQVLAELKKHANPLLMLGDGFWDGYYYDFDDLPF